MGELQKRGIGKIRCTHSASFASSSTSDHASLSTRSYHCSCLPDIVGMGVGYSEANWVREIKERKREVRGECELMRDVRRLIMMLQ